MKKITLFIMLAAAVGVSSCSVKKSTTDNQTIKNKGFSDIDEPFTEEKYKTNKDYIRGRGVAESPNLRFVEKLAEQDARTRIAAQIKTVLQDFLKVYANQYQNALGIDYSGKAEDITRSLINETLNGTEYVASKKQFNESTGIYRYYYVAQLPKKQVKENAKKELEKNVSPQERIRLDANMQMLDEEMDRVIEKQNGQQ
jgi:hypothetical protein